MCKPKSEGGQRCSFHLSQGVQTGVTAYAAALTGLSRDETHEAFEALRAEGAEMAAPSRGEVDSFLETQQFRVQHEPSLSAAKRTSILNRLRAAVGRVTPDGATFHAWKNVVGEAWARTRRRAAAVFLVSGLAFGMGGCATGPSTAAPATPVTSGPVATAPATSVTVARIDQVTYDKAAVAKFGQKNVESAGKFSTEFVAKYGANEALANKTPDQVSEADVKDITAEMTPAAQKSFLAALDTRQTNEGRANTYGVAFVGLNAGGYTMRTDVPGVSDVSVAKPVVSVNDGRLTVVQDYSATIRYKGPEGKNFKMTAEKQVTFWLVKGPSKDQPWLIDGWTANFGGTPVQADTF